MQITAAILAAIAATAAALSSIAILWVQRTKLFEDVRPQLVISGWRRNDTSSGNPCTEIIIDNIQNVGSGTALHVNINAFEIADDNRPTHVSQTINIDIIAPGQTIVINQIIYIYWNNVTLKGNTKIEFPAVKIIANDTLGKHLHYTKYELAVFKNPAAQIAMELLTNGVAGSRRTKRKYRKFICKKDRNRFPEF